MAVEEKLRAGETLFAAGNRAEAEAAFLEIIGLEPGHVRALNNLAVLALLDERLEKAEQWLVRAWQSAPDNPRTLNNWLELNLRRQRWPLVKEAAEALLAGGEDIKLLKVMVKAELALESYGPAGEATLRLRRLAPEDPEALEYSAYIHFKTGRPAEAEKELKSLLKLRPERTDLVIRLARLRNPEFSRDQDLWPDPAAGPLAAATRCHKVWGDIDSIDPALRAARLLGHLADPAALTDRDLPCDAPPPGRPGKSAAPASGDLAGLSIMFAPTIIAGQSAMMARWLKKRGVKTANVEISRNYLGYESDFYYPQEVSQLRPFIDLMLKKAEKCNVLCLDFGSSFSYMPNFTTRQDYRREKDPAQPYAELLPLKDKGVKIFFQFWGSDCTNQSITPYTYLAFLGFDNLPAPPPQTRFQHFNIRAASEVADVMLGLEYYSSIMVLPRVAPVVDVAIEPDRWPLKAVYRPRVEKILTAPTSPRKKNYTLIRAALDSAVRKHPELKPFVVHGVAHDQVPPLYAEADVGIDQATAGFGTFAVEMMALGLPVLSGRSPLLTEPARTGAPILHFTNVRELAARLEECISDPGRLPEIGRQGREYALENHSIETVGPRFARVLAEAAAGGAVPHIPPRAVAGLDDIWAMDPEKVHCFRFYDVAVPLFCALGEYEYGLALCLDALDCDYRPVKFSAWFQAIKKVSKMEITAYTPMPETPVLAGLRAECLKKLRDGRALLEEYAAMLKEADELKEQEPRGVMPAWEKEL